MHSTLKNTNHKEGVLSEALAKEGYHHCFMYYAYILKSEKDNSRHIGVTEDLKRRLVEHNSGGNKYSSTESPFHIVWYSAFPNKQQAYDFERYLKSGSGAAFMNKRLV